MDLLGWVYNPQLERWVPPDTPPPIRHRLQTRLPHELIAHIFQYISPRSALRCLLLNHAWYEESVRALYRNVQIHSGLDNASRRAFQFLRVTSGVAPWRAGEGGRAAVRRVHGRDSEPETETEPANFVRSLRLHFGSARPTRQGADLLARALRKMTALEKFTLDAKAVDLWAYDLRSPRLHTLDLRCLWSPELEKWLSERPSIQTINLTSLQRPHPLNIHSSLLPNLSNLIGPASLCRLLLITNTNTPGRIDHDGPTIHSQRPITRLRICAPSNTVLLLRVLELCAERRVVGVVRLDLETRPSYDAYKVLGRIRVLKHLSLRFTGDLDFESLRDHIPPILALKTLELKTSYSWYERKPEYWVTLKSDLHDLTSNLAMSLQTLEMVSLALEGVLEWTGWVERGSDFAGGAEAEFSGRARGGGFNVTVRDRRQARRYTRSTPIGRSPSMK